MPNKLFEALFAGLPLVVSDLDDMREFVTQHGLGLVFTNGEVGALVAALREVLAQRARYVDAEIREDLPQRLSFEREAAELLICYRGLAARDADLTR